MEVEHESMSSDGEQPTPSRYRRVRTRIRRADTWGLVATVVLSLATLMTAWCGYQSTRWGGESGDLQRDATNLRLQSTRVGDAADRQQTTDAVAFETWLEADITGATRLAGELAARFSPELRIAFDVWSASSPADQLTTGSPIDLEEYRPPGRFAEELMLTAAADLERQADEAQNTGDDYVFLAVVYAMVLFLIGVAPKLSDDLASQVAIVVGSVILVVAMIVTLTLPISVAA
jgi:hypothetical protein